MLQSNFILQIKERCKSFIFILQLNKIKKQPFLQINLNKDIYFFITSSLCIIAKLFSLLSADVAVATPLISMGAVLGKVTYMQLVFMGIIELIMFTINKYVGEQLFMVSLFLVSQSEEFDHKVSDKTKFLNRLAREIFWYDKESTKKYIYKYFRQLLKSHCNRLYPIMIYLF